MRTDLILIDHIGYWGSSSPGSNLKEDFGLGKNVKGKWVLFSCCGNCGDYNQIPVDEILDAIRMHKNPNPTGAENMMSLEQIKSISSEAASKAKKKRTKPFVIRNKKDLDLLKTRKKVIPFLGDYVPEGFYIKEEWFVDSSGFGQPGESAKTITHFFNDLGDLDYPFALAITEAGEFQVYVGIYGVN